jgi:hypothetical protein
VAIAGGTGQRYRLTAADAGHTVRMSEAAGNAAGVAAALSSAASAVVRGLPAGPSISGLRLTGLLGGRPRLALRLAASRWGPRLRQLEVILPAGLSFDRSLSSGRARAAVAVRGASGAIRVRLTVTARTVWIRFAGPRRTLRLAFGAPLLRAGSKLVSALRSHRATKLTLVVGAAGSGRSVLRTRRSLTVS